MEVKLLNLKSPEEGNQGWFRVRVGINTKSLSPLRKAVFRAKKNPPRYHKAALKSALDFFLHTADKF